MVRNRNATTNRKATAAEPTKPNAKSAGRKPANRTKASPTKETGQEVVSSSEAKVLKIFRQYLMTPGQMLCLSNVGIDSMQVVLSKMTEDGLIVPDDFKGAYSLTRTGYEAMIKSS